MKNSWMILLACFHFALALNAQERRTADIRKNVPLDSIVLSDPFILADARTNMYFMTGTGGALWKSKDLKLWDGPFRIAKTDSTSWMGSSPMIWAAEIHAYKTSIIISQRSPTGQ